jgi:hypothetical protein
MPFQKITVARHLKINENWDFWFENIASGNPGPDVGEK